MIPSSASLLLVLLVAPARGQEATDTGAPTTDTGAAEESRADTGVAVEAAPSDTGADEGEQVDTGTPSDTGAPPADTGAVDDTEGAPSQDTGASVDTGSPPSPEAPMDPGAPEGDPDGDEAPAAPAPVPVLPSPRPDPAPPRPIGPLPAVPFTPRSADAVEGEEAPGIEPYREPFSVLADRAIGTTSVPVEFDWRRNKVQVGAYGSFLSELNNFNSLRGGALVRFPTKRVVWEVGASYVAVGDTAATRDLALTPYRQAGRPRRAELDFGVGIPLAEGVITSRPRWFPAVQMVLNGYADLRYRIYPTGYRQLTLGQVAGSIVNPQLSTEERNNLEEARLDAMTVDRERFGLLLGIGNDFYFKPGLFLSPRVMFSVPLLAGVSNTQLLWWSDAQLAVGAAF